VTDFPLQQPNRSRAQTRGPLKVRRFLDGCENPDYTKGGLDWLAEVAIKMKALFKESRARLECSWDSGRGSADSANNDRRWQEISHNQYSKRRGIPSLHQGAQ
jgi:hypothetical protein